MNKDNVRINRFSDDYSISIDISQGVLLTPMSSCATALFDFFRQFSDEEPNFPWGDVDRPSDSLLKMSMEIEKDPSTTWQKLRPLWLNEQWTAWICSGVVSLYLPIDTVRSLLNGYEKLSLPVPESLKALA